MFANSREYFQTHIAHIPELAKYEILSAYPWRAVEKFYINGKTKTFLIAYPTYFI